MKNSEKTVTITTKRKLSNYEFLCTKCQKIHTKSTYAIAQCAMNNRLIFTCECGNKIYL